MAILHTDCKKRLVEVVAQGLPVIIAKNGMFLDRVSVYMGLYQADEVIPKSGKLAKQLIEYVNESPILDFISETLSTELQDLDKYHKEPALVKLVEIEGYADPTVTAQQLIDQFDTLPWKYTLTLTLPEKVSSILRPYITESSLSEDIKLIKPNTDFISKFPRKSSDENKDKRIRGRNLLFSLFGDDDPKWDDDAILLQINVQGFIGLYGTTTPAQKGIEIVRAFCGLGLALRLFKVKYSYSPTPPNFTFDVHKSGRQWELDGRLDLGNNYSKALNDLEINDGIEQVDSDERKARWIKVVIEEMRLVFSNPQKAEKIILAAQWLFDSHSGQDELLSFVQAMVVLEILLGDKDTSDEIGLGELLRNRCAYLIGKSHQERSQLLIDFKEIYRVRSQIVHRGKSKLTGDERVLFNKLRQMCHKVIQEEVDLLKADIVSKN